MSVNPAGLPRRDVAVHRLGGRRVREPRSCNCVLIFQLTMTLPVRDMSQSPVLVSHITPHDVDSHGVPSNAFSIVPSVKTSSTHQPRSWSKAEAESEHVVHIRDALDAPATDVLVEVDWRASEHHAHIMDVFDAPGADVLVKGRGVDNMLFIAVTPDSHAPMSSLNVDKTQLSAAKQQFRYVRHPASRPRRDVAVRRLGCRGVGATLQLPF